MREKLPSVRPGMREFLQDQGGRPAMATILWSQLIRLFIVIFISRPLAAGSYFRFGSRACPVV